ncbi:MAG: FAD binding domain-containing protein [Anaerolineae bacterium]
MKLWDVYYTATSLEDAIRLLSEHGEQARIVAGGTDLIVEIEHGTRTPPVLIDITRVGGLDAIREEEDHIHIGPMVTHAQAARSKLIQEQALPLAQACWAVGAPALRNRGTIAGNIITASPANDTIPALNALNATVTLRSERGTRTVPIGEFYVDVRHNTMASDEMLVDIAVPKPEDKQQGIFLRLTLRRELAISVVNVAMMVTKGGNDIVTEARIALGGVAPTIIRAPEAESSLVGGPMTDARIREAAGRAAEATRPIDDVRGSAWFRSEEVKALVGRGLKRMRDGDIRMGLPTPSEMVTLWGSTRRWPRLSGPTIAHHADGDEPIQTVVNGENVTLQGANGKTLLRLLRENLGLTGTKVGCEEGECGACTVWLDGIAVLACLVPAPRAHGACIATVEGLSADGTLHPVQQAFIDADAAQCGYCTPGFVMSAAKLLEQFPSPSRTQIKTALSGNLCRCTGYYKIIEAVERAAKR